MLASLRAPSANTEELSRVQIVVATYIGGVAGALSAVSYSSSLPSGVQDVIAGRLSPSRIGIRPGSVNSLWWISHVSNLFIPISSTADGLQQLADGQIDGVFAGVALQTYFINQGLCSLAVTPDQVRIFVVWSVLSVGLCTHSAWLVWRHRAPRGTVHLHVSLQAFPTSYAFAFPPEFAYLDAINQAISDITLDGTIASLNQNYVLSSRCGNSVSDSSSDLQVGVGTLGGVFVVLSLFAASALAIYSTQFFCICYRKGKARALDFFLGRGRYAGDGGGDAWGDTDDAPGRAESKCSLKKAELINNLAIIDSERVPFPLASLDAGAAPSEPRLLGAPEKTHCLSNPRSHLTRFLFPSARKPQRPKSRAHVAPRYHALK